MGSEDQRKAPRIARAFLVRYRSSTTVVASWLVSPLRDLSSGGARFLSERALSVGDELELQLVLPISRDPVTIKGKVAWTGSAKFGMVEVGVTFETTDAITRQILETAVVQFLNRTSRR